MKSSPGSYLSNAAGLGPIGVFYPQIWSKNWVLVRFPRDPAVLTYRPNSTHNPSDSAQEFFIKVVGFSIIFSTPPTSSSNDICSSRYWLRTADMSSLEILFRTEFHDKFKIQTGTKPDIQKFQTLYPCEGMDVSFLTQKESFKNINYSSRYHNLSAERSRG